MIQLLQWLGGGFYLLNKIFLWNSERLRNNADEHDARLWRIAAWVVYLIGLPPWVIIFVIERNWIAASVETSGVPAMVLGLVMALRGREHQPPKWLDRTAILCIVWGFGYSLYDFGGLTTLTQWLEIVLVAGFLIGTYALAKHRSSGYLWYILMHVSCGWLMWVQAYPWLALQQFVSLLFIVAAYRRARR